MHASENCYMVCLHVCLHKLLVVKYYGNLTNTFVSPSMAFPLHISLKKEDFRKLGVILYHYLVLEAENVASHSGRKPPPQ